MWILNQNAFLEHNKASFFSFSLSQKEKKLLKHVMMLCNNNKYIKKFVFF